jgi:hypothetical protein
VHAVFWIRISFDIPTTAGTPWRLANTMAVFSLLVVLGCVAFRRYLHPLERLL